MFENIFNKKWYNNFSIGVILAALLALGISIFLFFRLHELLELLKWGASNTELMALIAAPYLITFAGRLVSGAGYLMKPLDIVLADNTVLEITSKLDTLKAEIEARAVKKRIQNNTGYFTGNVLGILLSAATTTLQVIGKSVTYAAVFGPFAIPLLALDNAGTDAGFLSRILWVVESFFNKKTGKLSVDAFMNDQRLNARLGIMGGICIAIGVLALTAVTIASPVGPLAIALMVASFVGVIGSSAAAGEYIGDVADVFLGPRTIFGYVKDLIVGNKPSSNFKEALTGKRKHEYRGKLIGIAIATLVIVGAAALIAAHIICPPTLGITIILGLCATSFSAFPGIFGRIMKTFDIKNIEMEKMNSPEINADNDSEKESLLGQEQEPGHSDNPTEADSHVNSEISSSATTPRSTVNASTTPRMTDSPNITPRTTDNSCTSIGTASSSTTPRSNDSSGTTARSTGSSSTTPRDTDNLEKNDINKAGQKEVPAKGSTTTIVAAFTAEKASDKKPVLPANNVTVATEGIADNTKNYRETAPLQKNPTQYGLSTSQPILTHIATDENPSPAVRRASTPPPPTMIP